MIIIDRNIDMLTPLLRQTVYEGVADEFYGINGGLLRIPTNKFDESQPNKDKKEMSAYKQIKLNS